MSLGQFIKEKRIENNLSLEQLGKKIGVSKMTISRWESGEIKNMGADKIEKLASALDVPIIALFNGFDENGDKIETEKISRIEFNNEVTSLLSKTNSVITRKDFANIVTSLLSKTNGINEQEKALLIQTLNLICSDKK